MINKKLNCRYIALAVAVLSVTAMVSIVDETDEDSSAEVTTTATVCKGITVPVGGQKTIFVSLNLTSFEYVDPNDGYKIGIEESSGLLIECLKKDSTNVTGVPSAWPTDSSSTTVNVTTSCSVHIVKVDDTGVFGIEVTLSESSSTTFTVYFYVTSNKITQRMAYEIVVEPLVNNYSFSFVAEPIGIDAVFSGQGSMLVNGVEADLSNYRFYAYGLKTGVALHNDLTLTGRADKTISEWSSSNVMNFKIIVSDISAGTTDIVDASVSYSFSTAGSKLTYAFRVNGESVAPSNDDSSITVLSSDRFLLNISDGTNAEIITLGDQGEMTQKYVMSKSGQSEYVTLDNSGIGTYSIVFSKIGVENTERVFINVLGSLVPINSINVSCGLVVED